ncbi:MAG: hypothetical protein JXB03_05735 [Spirochaetales bacterium]|nr:hypothetical protein [Spirochaetales bacterium]
MRQYKVKGEETAYLTVLGETDDELQVEIVRERNGMVIRSSETISRNLFETCIHTSYLTPYEEPAAAYRGLEPALSA